MLELIQLVFRTMREKRIMLKLSSNWRPWIGITVALLVGLAAAVGAQGPVVPKVLTAQPPLWPIALETPEVPADNPGPTGAIPAPVLIWVPEGAKHLRALFIVPNNSDSKIFAEYKGLRAVAKKHEMGVVYMRKGDVAEIQSVLDAAAVMTGIPEFRYAPWIVFGKSSRGKFPIVAEWTYPKRTIASIEYHGETPTWPPDATAKHDGETILHLNANGETEWGGTWFIHVRPSLLNYRAQKGWLAHQSVAKGVGHGDYVDAHGSPGWGDLFPGKVTCINVWDYISIFMDKALTIRVPKDKYATDGPVMLNQVDEASGYLIDPFAVEELFRQPHYPLIDSPNGYLVGSNNEGPVTGYAAVPPVAAPEKDAPVALLTVGKSPTTWLATEGMKFAMVNDPMTNLNGLEKLRPNAGDKVKIDDYEATFKKLSPSKVPKEGGISLNGIKKFGAAVTIIGYTVLEVPETTNVKLNAPFSVAGRLQVVLNGVPIVHKQVVELQKGFYPMLVVLLLDGPNWGSIAPFFEKVSDEEITQAKALETIRLQRKADEAAMLAAPPKKASELIFKATDVPKEKRSKMFWVADREQAEAWFNLHAVNGQKFDLPL